MNEQLKYELCIVFKPNLDEETLKAEFDKILALLEKTNSTIDKVDNWGKRKLAYEIDKVHEGFYYFITFIADASVPAEIERNMRITETVLRYLTIRQEA